MKLDQGYCRGICYTPNSIFLWMNFKWKKSKFRRIFHFPCNIGSADGFVTTFTTAIGPQLPLETKKTIDIRWCELHSRFPDWFYRFSLSSDIVACSTDVPAVRLIGIVQFAFSIVGLPLSVVAIVVKMNCPKWLPKDLQGSYHLFTDLSRAAVTFKWLTNRYLNEIAFDYPDVQVRIP